MLRCSNGCPLIAAHPLEALARILARVVADDIAPIAKAAEFEAELRRSTDGRYEGLRRLARFVPEIDRRKLVVLVDQFEETYTLCTGPAEQDAFVGNLLHAAQDAGGDVSVKLSIPLEGHADRVYGAVFAPDGRILTASADKTARLWDRDGKPLATLQGHTGEVWSAVFAPDGRRILTASDDSTARLWDRDGKLLATLQGHTDWVNSAVFAPDGGRILTASADETMRLWDRDGKPLATLRGHAGPVYSPTSPTGCDFHDFRGV
jgi:WD40 repeat protein